MTDRDEMVRVVAEVLRGHAAGYAPHPHHRVRWCICGREAWTPEHEARAVVDAVGERLAQAWDEGKGAALTWVYRQDDADAAGQHYLVPEPRNPYRTDERADR
jgi:hypothetical protein